MESFNQSEEKNSQFAAQPAEATIDEQFKQTIEELRNLEKKNLRINRFKLFFLFIAMAAFIAAAVFVYLKTESTLKQIDEMTASLTEAGKDISKVANDLEKFDFEKMSTSLRNIIDISEQTVQQVSEASSGLTKVLEAADVAMSHINSISFENLNNGIQKLNDILEPVAKFFHIVH